jgi:hypothetical protein
MEFNMFISHKVLYISDKHEIIVKQMTSKCESQMNSSFFAGEITDLEWAESVNRNIDLRLPSKIKANMNLLF